MLNIKFLQKHAKGHRYQQSPEVRVRDKKGQRFEQIVEVGGHTSLAVLHNQNDIVTISILLPVPCALEAQTVINTSCFDWRFPRKREKVRQ